MPQTSMPQETADLVTFTEEILNGKLHFLCNGGISGMVVLRINNLTSKKLY